MANRIRGKNEGSIFKRENGTWRAQIYINGKRISYSAKTRQECQNWLRENLTLIDHGNIYENSDTTVNMFLAEWINKMEFKLRSNTFYQYKQTISKHILPYLGNLKLKDLQASRIENFYIQLTKAEVGVRTVRLVHSILHCAFEHAVRYGWLIKNPSHRVLLPRYRQKEMHVLEEHEVTKFLTSAQKSPYHALYHIALVTGMRQGEIFGLKWSDLDWNTGKLSIKRQVQHVPGKSWDFSEPKTRAGKRIINLGNNSLALLHTQYKRVIFLKQIAGKYWKENDLVFPSSVGSPLNPSNLRKDFLKVLKDAGVSIIRFHDLRHTAASLMLNHGIPIIVVSNILGHSKPSVTLDVYGHLYNEMQGQASKLMDELISPIKIEIPKSTSNIFNQLND